MSRSSYAHALRPWLRPLVIGGACVLLPGRSTAAPTQPGELVNPIFAPHTCELCHGNENALIHDDDPDYSAMRSWQGSMMANSARDPVFWAGVAVADADQPGGTELCVRCHAPRAFLDGHGSVTRFEDLLPEEQEGIECAFCHRTVEDAEASPGNAQYTIDDVLVDGINVARRGPWDYTDGVPEPPHTYLFDTYLGTSRFCGTCHDVTTEAERVDDSGVGLGVSFNEQRTYSEWLGSAYATPGPDFRSCQDCHMPAVADKPGCTEYLNQHSHPTGGVRHDLVGANRFMVELIRDQYGSAGANLIADFYFDNTIEAIDAFLPSSATLEVEAPQDVDLTEGLSALAVTVTNNTGHKLPTGYSEGRVMWIEVIAEYDGQVVYSSGAWDQQGGLQRDDQLRTYEGHAERWSDGTIFHLLLNDHWVEDTRIPPRGLTPNLETDPVGGRYTLLPDGTWPHYDRHRYDFPAAPEIADATPDSTEDDALRVTVRLRYLINTPEYIDFLGAEAGDAGSHVATLFDLAGGAPPLVLTEQTVAIPIVGFGATATSGADTTTTTGDGESTTTGPASTTAETTGPGVPPVGTAGSTTTSGSEGSSGGALADDSGAGGCTCRGGAPTPAGLVWLPWLLLGLRRRRT